MRSDLIETKIVFNRQTKDLTTSFESHRQKVMQLIEATVRDLSGDAPQPCDSITLLGAGNCLDVDLLQLSEWFKSVHLVDLDKTAVQDAVTAANVNDDRLHVHAPVDIAQPLLSLTSRDLQAEQDNPEHFANVLQHLSTDNAVTEVPESDVVVSLCVLSQLFGSLMELAHQHHPSFEKTTRAVRLGHLRRMLSMVRPGGVGILVTDVVSSETAPELTSATESEMTDLLSSLLKSKNFFSGTNPANALADLGVLSRLPNGPESVHTIDPWPWHLGDRTYAVYGLRFQKKLPLAESDVPTPDKFD